MMMALWSYVTEPIVEQTHVSKLKNNSTIFDILKIVQPSLSAPQRELVLYLAFLQR